MNKCNHTNVVFFAVSVVLMQIQAGVALRVEDKNDEQNLLAWFKYFWNFHGKNVQNATKSIGNFHFKVFRFVQNIYFFFSDRNSKTKCYRLADGRQRTPDGESNFVWKDLVKIRVKISDFNFFEGIHPRCWDTTNINVFKTSDSHEENLEVEEKFGEQNFLQFSEMRGKILYHNPKK